MSKKRQSEEASVPVRSFGVTFGGGNLGRRRPYAPPQHDGWHQLIHVTEGVVRVRTRASEWLVEPGRGVWIPAGMGYELVWSGEVALRMLYVWPEAMEVGECAVVRVGALLRELIVRVNLLGALDTRKPEQGRLLGVLLDEMRLDKCEGVELPLPRDGRAVKFLRHLETGLDVDRALRKAGASRRTMERVFSEETRLSLGKWLRRRAVLQAVGMLAQGISVGNVAQELGYGSASAFVAMFVREMGRTPGRYLEGMAN